ncbi:MAG: glycosyltransferase [Syntrophorhabdales bacterium]
MITYNNAATIEKALMSVKDWATEIVVVDSESTDGAPGIVKRYTERLVCGAAQEHLPGEAHRTRRVVPRSRDPSIPEGKRPLGRRHPR